MKKLFQAIAIAFPLVAISALSAEACRFGVYSAEPSAESRWIENDGYRFKVPTNYRAELRADGSVEVLDPDAYQYLSCLRASPYGSDLPQSLTVSTIDSRVQSRSWPYDIPYFQWFQDTSTFNYGEYYGQLTAMFTSFDGYSDAWLWHGVQNLSGGGSAYVQSAVFDEVSEYVHMLAWMSLEEVR